MSDHIESGGIGKNVAGHRSHLRYKSIAAVFLVVVSVIGDAGPEGDPADLAALRALDQAYVDGWKLDDPRRQEEAVLSLFAEDGVIMPGGGMAPKSGREQLKAFWFPEGAPPTKVLSFEHDVDGIDVDGNLGVVYGRSSLRFEYAGKETAQQGNFMLVGRKGEDGNWRVRRMIWNNRTVD